MTRNLVNSKLEIVLKFDNEEDVKYINLVCRRKGIDLLQYILDNFEWDDLPACIRPEVIPRKDITCDYCDGCDFRDGCPDVKADVNE